MDIKVQRIGVWLAPIGMAIFGIGFWGIAGFIPPPSPEKTPAQVAAIFQSNTTGIRIGLWMTMMAAALLGPWVAVVTVHMRRIEGRHSTLAYLQLGFGVLGIIEFIIPAMIWQGIAFRPYGDPEFTQRLNDVTWLMFVGAVSTAFVQAMSIGIAILGDERAVPVFPRWAGYFNIWIATLFTPAGLIVFFKTGPFAWNGIFTFWLLLTSFTVWLCVMTWLMLTWCIPQQAAEAAPAPVAEVVAAPA